MDFSAATWENYLPLTVTQIYDTIQLIKHYR